MDIPEDTIKEEDSENQPSSRLISPKNEAQKPVETKTKTEDKSGVNVATYNKKQEEVKRKGKRASKQETKEVVPCQDVYLDNSLNMEQMNEEKKKDMERVSY